MTQINYLDLAKTGEPRVIAGLLNRSLEIQGIRTKATRRNNEVHLLLEGQNLLDQEEALVTFLLEALARLQVPATLVTIYAKAPDQGPVLWEKTLNYPGPPVPGIPAMPSNFIPAAPETAEPEMTSDDRFDDLTEAEAALDNLAEEEAAFGDLDDDFLDEEEDGFEPISSFDTTTQESSDLNLLSPLSPNDYLEPQAHNGNGTKRGLTWPDSNGSHGLGGGTTDSLESSQDPDMMGSGYGDTPQMPQEVDEEPGSGKSGLPMMVVTVMALVAMAFLGAAAYYRFFMLQQAQDAGVVVQQSEPPVADPGTDLGNPPPDSLPSIAPEATDTTPLTPPEPPVDTTSTITAVPSANPWRDAVNRAMAAAEAAQTAQTSDDWSAVATTWDEAIALLLSIPEADPNYARAQEKVVEYTRNLDYARANETRVLNGQ